MMTHAYNLSSRCRYEGFSLKLALGKKKKARTCLKNKAEKDCDVVQEVKHLPSKWKLPRLNPKMDKKKKKKDIKQIFF
jgi:hypothetical protein